MSSANAAVGFNISKPWASRKVVAQRGQGQGQKETEIKMENMTYIGALQAKLLDFSVRTV